MILSLLIAGAAATVQPSAQPAASASHEINYEQGQLGFAAMQSGQNDHAIRQLEQASTELPDDPARLINLGTAYARVGRIDDARATLERAASAERHFDLILADGRVVDSRRAALYALDRVERRRTVNIASGN